MRIDRQNLEAQRQAALAHIAGVKAPLVHDVKTDHEKLFNALNDSDSDKRPKCLSYCAVAAILRYESVNIFITR